MPRGEKLPKFLALLMLHDFYGVVIVRMEADKVVHVETETRRAWHYKDLPEEIAGPLEPAHNRSP